MSFDRSLDPDERSVGAAGPTPSSGHPAPADLSEQEARAQIVEVGRWLYRQGLVVSTDGNLSIRLGERIVMTPRGACKGRLAAEDPVLVDGAGRLLQPGQGGQLPSSELAMHLEVYRQRDDVAAVLHAHPPYATALTVAGIPLYHDVLPEIALALGQVPTTRLAAPSSEDGAAAIRNLIAHHDALLLRNHGSLTVGATLEEAYLTLERVEHAARVIFMAHLLGHVGHLPGELVDELAQIARSL